MNQIELMQDLHTLNESELFYRRYQEAHKSPESLRHFLDSLDMDYVLEKHFIVPEIVETMPPSMKDEYFFNNTDIGIILQKHNCYTPAFRHFHTYFEAFYVFEGICHHEIAGQSRVLRMGDFCIVPPGTSHTISVQDRSIVIVMILSSEVIENVFKNPTYYKQNALADFFLKNIHFSSDNNYLMFHTGNDQELKDLIIQMMLESINRYQEYDAILYSQFAIFFAKLIRYYEGTIETPSQNQRNSGLAYDIMTFIRENHDRITLDDVARHFNYTPEYTSKLIKKVTNSTFMNLVTDSRMKHAVSLLKSTRLSVAQIANQVGYENAENFIRTFRKKYSMTPSAYRKVSDSNYIV